MSRLIQLFLLLFSWSASLALGSVSPIALDLKGVSLPDSTRRNLPNKRATSQAVPVTFDKNSIVYTVDVQIGTPPQSFVLVLEFNYADSVIIARNGHAVTTETYTRGRYSANDSSTYQYIDSKLSLIYGNGSSVTGDYFADTVVIGGTTVSNVQMSVAYNGTLPDSYLGLGYNDPQTTDSDYPNLISSLYQNGKLLCEAFSLWMSSPDAANGQLVLGGIDTGKFEGNLQTVPIEADSQSTGYITLSLDSLTYKSSKNVPIVTASTPVTFGAWTSYMYLPENVTTVLFTQLGMTYSDTDQYASGKCSDVDNSTSFDFQFGSKTITLSANQLVSYYTTTGTTDYCYAYVLPSTAAPYTFGTAFMQQLYMVFDLTNNFVSLAPIASNSSTNNNITTIPAGGVAGFVSTATSGSSTNTTSGNNGTTTTNPTSGHHSGLSTAAKAGIGVGAGLGGILVLSLIAFCLFRSRKNKRGAAAAATTATRQEEEARRASYNNNGYYAPQGNWGKPELAAADARRREELDAVEQERRYGYGQSEMSQRRPIQELQGDFSRHELESPHQSALQSTNHSTTHTRSSASRLSNSNTATNLTGQTSPTTVNFSRSSIPRRKPVGGAPQPP